MARKGIGFTCMLDDRDSLYVSEDPDGDICIETESHESVHVMLTRQDAMQLRDWLIAALEAR